MPIKYAEITIVRNLEEESWLSYFKNLIGEENIITNNDTIIISFDDGSISDTKSDLVDKKFKFGPQSYHQDCPLYFEKKDKNNTFFLKTPRLERVTEPRNLFSYTVLKLDSRVIFKDYKNNNTLKKEPSIYNVIYHTGVNQVLAIVKNGNNHRYVLAYDDDYFDKSDIKYFVSMLFTNSFTYEIRDNTKCI
jgi:hypothetical protein